MKTVNPEWEKAPFEVEVKLRGEKEKVKVKVVPIRFTTLADLENGKPVAPFLDK